MSSSIILDQTSEDRWRHRHPFPVLDFKFRNTGLGTSFLTSFQVNILNAEIDIEPDLDFTWSIGGPERTDNYGTPDREFGSSLRISVNNYGWGSAHSLKFNSVDKLEELFDKPSFEGGELVGVKSELIREYSISDLNKEKFKARAASGQASDAKSLRANHLGWPRGINSFQAIFDKGVPYLVIEEFKFTWECTDDLRRKYRGKEKLTNRQMGHWGGDVVLTEKGFFFLSHGPVAAYAVQPGPTTCVMIDPELGAHVRSYRLSRGVKGGEIERFQILIGASMSCALDLKFGFVADGSKRLITSDPMSLYIANSRYNAYHDEYRDGQVILDEVTDQMERQARAAGR